MLNRKTLTLAMAATFGLVAVATAQFPGVQGSVERQIQLLEQKKQFAAGQISKADEAMADLDYGSAYAYFKSAVDILPQGSAAGCRSLVPRQACLTQLRLQRAQRGVLEGVQIVRRILARQMVVARIKQDALVPGRIINHRHPDLAAVAAVHHQGTCGVGAVVEAKRVRHAQHV